VRRTAKKGGAGDREDSTGRTNNGNGAGKESTALIESPQEASEQHFPRRSVQERQGSVGHVACLGIG
jgi:hypothetical protein